MPLFKYFKKVERTVSESAQATGLKEVEENEIQKHLQSTSKLHPKKLKIKNSEDFQESIVAQNLFFYPS